MIPRLEIHFDRKERRLFRKGTNTADCRNGEFLLNHARSGLQLALQALQLPPKSGVGMMVYNCHTVMNSICQAGYTPIFVDVTDGMTIDMEDLARKRSQMKVLIVTHLFGIINDIKAIKAKYPDLIIIEDCAHCFGHEIEGEMGVYSVGQGKFPSIGDGGLLKVRGERLEVREKIDELYSRLPGYGRMGEMKLFVRLWIKAWMYKPLIYNLITLRLKAKRMKELKNEGVKEEVVLRKMSCGVANILEKKRKHYAEAVAERIENARVMNERVKELESEGAKVLIGENGFMLVVRTKDVDGLKEHFSALGIETETHFAHCIDWAQQFEYQIGSCPNAERLTKQLLMIPTYRRF